MSFCRQRVAGSRSLSGNPDDDAVEETVLVMLVGASDTVGAGEDETPAELSS